MVGGMMVPALIVISPQMLDRRKQVLNLPQEFPLDIDDLVAVMGAEIIWDKHETMLFIDSYDRMPRSFNEWLQDDHWRNHAYWDISDGHLRRANGVEHVVRKLIPPYGHPVGHGYIPHIKPEVFAKYLLSGNYHLYQPFKQFLESYTPPPQSN